MTKEMIQEIAERIVIKIRCEQLHEEEFKNNKRQNPFHSERQGMVEMLKLMGLDFEYHYNDDVTEITGITIEGITVEV